MFKYVLYFLLAWFLYNLIFRFIVPVFKAGRQMKRQFRQMQENMQQQMDQQQGNNNPFQQQAEPRPKAKPDGDYIDFEEVN